MNAKRFSATILALLLGTILLTGCGTSGKSADGTGNKTDPSANATSTPTVTPTPTEVPKTPEQEDFETITRLFEAAESTIAGTQDSVGVLPEGTRFLIRFEDDHLATGFETTDEGFQRRIWESWIRSAGLERANHPFRSDTYKTGCQYGIITGVVDKEGKITWTADNLSDAMFASLASIGVEKSPEYLKRVALSEELIGEWDGVYALSMDSLIDAYLANISNLSRDRYTAFVSFLQQYGFTGSFYFKAHCSIRSEKECNFSLNVDLSSFFNAIQKAASTREGMTQLLCVSFAIDEDSLISMLKSNNLDVMTYGAEIIGETEAAYRKAYSKNVDEVCTYTYKDPVLHLIGNVRINLTYDRKSQTMTYSESDLEITLKKQ